MTQILLSDDEAAVLKLVLEQVIPDLRMEIADTENKELRDKLKEREAILKKIEKKLETAD